MVEIVNCFLVVINILSITAVIHNFTIFNQQEDKIEQQQKEINNLKEQNWNLIYQLKFYRRAERNRDYAEKMKKLFQK